MRHRVTLTVALCVLITTGTVAQASVLGHIRQSISSLWDRKAGKRQAARSARHQATALRSQAGSLHERLEATQQALQTSNSIYYNYFQQMRRTEAKLVETRHRRQIVTARYNRRRILFGRRLAAMQRSGRLSYLQMFLGSQTLSDLTRRAYLFNTLTARDAQLQEAMKNDKVELEHTQVLLAREWHERNVLQKGANRERLRIARAEGEQQRILYRINSSQYEMAAYAQAQERSSREIGSMINDLEGRRASIIASYENSAGHVRGRVRRRRVVRRVTRMRMVAGEGGLLKPMPISQLEIHTEVVPETGSKVGNGWDVPVRGPLSSRYGVRYHPILHRRKMHTGDDIAARYGTPFRAARNGRVLWSGWKKAYGNTVIIDHGDGTTSLYGHASKLSVRPGQPIKAGEYIGNVGSTGWSTGPHLHFEVRKNGRAVDPTKYLRGGKKQ